VPSIVELVAGLANNIDMINNSTEVTDLKNSLGGFTAMSTNLFNAQMTLMNELGRLGYKIQLKPN
jgi:hypothetical protein